MHADRRTQIGVGRLLADIVAQVAFERLERKNAQ
jgi:hypothetical protein